MKIVPRIEPCGSEDAKKQEKHEKEKHDGVPSLFRLILDDRSGFILFIISDLK